ncbi:mCG146821 [Mus musculus]|nr:mCG146821 [Mus musculus]
MQKAQVQSDESDNFIFSYNYHSKEHIKHFYQPELSSCCHNLDCAGRNTFRLILTCCKLLIFSCQSRVCMCL